MGGGLRTHKGVAAGAFKMPGGLIHQQRTVLLSVGATACVGLTAFHVTFCSWLFSKNTLIFIGAN